MVSTKRPFEPNMLPIEISWSDLITLLGDANSAVARYDGLLESIPNPEILLAPLLTQEAVLSSKIEGTQATLEEVLEFEADPRIASTRKDDIEEVINYRVSLQMAKDELKERPICLNLVKDIHRILLQGVRGQFKSRGEFRKTQNWIGSPGTPIEMAMYIPPEPTKMMECLTNWEKYCHYAEKDKIVQLSILHAQFELIHPFLDGNGRIGRIFIPIFLYDRKILNQPMFYISAFFETHRDEYYARLAGISEYNDWKGWIEFFLNAIIVQSRQNSEKAKTIMKLYADMKQKIAELTHSQYSIQILDFLFKMPIFRSSSIAEFTNIPAPSAARIIKCLVEGNVIATAVKGKGRRPALYIFPDLLTATKL